MFEAAPAERTNPPKPPPKSWAETTKISSTASSMASEITGKKKSYPAPKIPNTPSESINSMLEQKCGKEFDNPVKAGVAHYIALVFTFINRMYEMIHKDTKPSHKMWMASCGAVAAAIVLKVFIAYHIIMASSFLIHFFIYYLALAMALFGVGLGVAGAVFFDKDSSKAATGFAGKTKTRVMNTVNKYADEAADKMDQKME